MGTKISGGRVTSIRTISSIRKNATQRKALEHTTDLALLDKLGLLLQNLALLVQSSEQVHDGDFLGGGVDVHDTYVARADDALVLENVDFGVKIAAALHEAVLLTHDKAIAQVFLLDALDLHAHVVARLSHVDLR